MKLVSFVAAHGEPGVAVAVDEWLVDVTDVVASIDIPAERRRELSKRGIAEPASGMLRLLYAGPRPLAALARRAASFGREKARVCPLRAARLLAPVPRPGKVVAVGRNYADHAKETGVEAFGKPRIIAKLPSSVVGPGAAVKRPAAVAKMDFEAELAVVIGEFAAGVAREKALGIVAGYTALNDLSAREFQLDVSPAQTTFAKSMDGFCPMGPWLVTKDEIPDPQALELACRVNGAVMQRGRTADMIFPVDVLIEHITRYMTLEPGDVIATGTPSGAGAFRTPPVWLQPGDRLRVEISGIGALENTIV